MGKTTAPSTTTDATEVAEVTRAEVLAILAEIMAAPASDDIPASAFDILATYGRGDEFAIAQSAYVTRTRRAEGMADAKATATEFAKRTGRNRTTLATWATACGYVVDSGAVLSEANYRHALYAYHTGKDGRAYVVGKVKELGKSDAETLRDWDQIARDAKASQALADAKVAPASAPESPESGDGESDTRMARPSDGAEVAEHTVRWLAALVALAESAGQGAESWIVLTTEQAEQAEDALATIGSYVTALVEVA
jgi:hypothetical protein